ncbi:MAG TPA: four helix bundle protein [Balneola sp.]|jgi:four helix bundle protein|nr:four helix bundle protein [Balneola sp.]HCI69111.1 four helix bundle protein [Balneola sp.]HCT53168.1 four helix bundle protein [Balneola sp.]|tara:strand:- start:274 stop:639 length:366 start_codon:yes stop_codon:yes gene_type:complete
MSYRNSEIWQLAKEQSNKIHFMSLKLPKFELYETGSQIRRSSKSVRSNIVEGYGRRSYKKEYVRFLIFALASNDETRDHLDSLYETQSLKSKELYLELIELNDKLGKKLNLFIQSVERTQS